MKEVLLFLNLLFSKYVSVRQVQGAYGAQERSVHEVHEHLSTAAIVHRNGLGKKSIELINDGAQFE